MDRPIYDTVLQYSRSEDTPWHMPGHKRKLQNVIDNPYAVDVTEIPGMDEYHSPEGIILEAQRNAANYYQSKDSWFLVNGSTVGILASISAVCGSGEKILVARNCHKSVYNAIELLQLQAHYVEPEWLSEWDVYGGVSSEKVRLLLKENPGIKAVVITSPTYEGVVSDVEALAQVIHEAGAVLIVDEAHGAHFPFVKEMPVSAVELGADLVIQSLHKTLPALTQTAILHRATEAVDREKVFHYVSLYQSTSPSYVLLASIDYAIDYMIKEEARKELYVVQLDWIREQLRQCSKLRLLSWNDLAGTCAREYDNGKLMLSAKGCDMSGAEMAAFLAKRGHVAEMYGSTYVLLMTSVMDEESDYRRLVADIQELDGTIKKCQKRDDILIRDSLPLIRCSIHDAINAPQECCELKKCLGKVSGSYVYAYPPGSPILVPGEQITESVLAEITFGLEQDLNMKGLLIAPEGAVQLLVLQER